MSEIEIKKAGLRVTAPRVLVMKILCDTTDHLSAEAIYQKIRECPGQDIGLATVYRVLSQLEDSNLVLRHQFDERGAVYELNDGKHHDHLLCVKCNTIIEFFDKALEQKQDDIAQANGFILESHSLVMFGVCSKCQLST